MKNSCEQFEHKRTFTSKAALLFLTSLERLFDGCEKTSKAFISQNATPMGNSHSAHDAANVTPEHHAAASAGDAADTGLLNMLRQVN